MNKIFTLILLLTISFSIKSQNFLWAESYNITECNEVAALSLDTEGNIFIAGIHDAPVFLPYKGNAYIQKASADGEVLWAESILGTLIIGDMATVGNKLMIIGQSNGAFSYRDEQFEGGEYFMFVMMINSEGEYLWHFTDETKYGVNTNISVGNTGNIALHIRGQFNLGDWILIVDEEGNIQNSKLISATETLVVDMAYYDEKVYLNGGYSGNGSIMIDTIIIETPPVEHATFVLALDENLLAEWVATDTTINNRDGRIVADAGGVFSYQSVLRTPFTFISLLKKFSLDGQLLAEVEPPVFSNAVALYPDMAITPGSIAFFAQNNFGFDSHKVMLFDHDLNITSEKEINGQSDLYSGQIASYEENIFVAHVHSGSLNFNDELMLNYSGTGKLPYIAKIGGTEITGLTKTFAESIQINVFPNPASDFISINLTAKEMGKGIFAIFDLKGNLIKNGIINTRHTRISVDNLPAGVYVMQTNFEDGSSKETKIVTN